jgi:tetratricopeptide (TPR) repeat protein
LGTGHPTLGPVAHFNRGRALLDADRPAEARQALQQAIQGSSDASLRSRAWHNIGATHLAAQEWDPAIEAYRHALRQDPKNEDARTNLAYAMRQKKQGEKNESSPKNQDSKQDKQDQQSQQNQQNQQQRGDEKGENSQPKQDPKGENGDGKKGDKPGEERPEQGAGQPEKGMTREEAVRLLESLQQDEAAIQARLREKRVQGKPRKIEKDW